MRQSLESAMLNGIALPTIDEMLDLLDKDAGPFDLSLRDTGPDLFPAHLADLVERQARAA